MSEKIAGYLEVGVNDDSEVVINHPDLKPDENGVGHIVFSPAQARNLAALLVKNANDADAAIHAKQEAARIASVPPVDRSARILANGKAEVEMPDYRDIDPATGQQKAYVVLTPEERARGFVRPVRRTYLHKPCGTTTTMGLPIAETYARDPHFYSGTFCVHCGSHFGLDQFVWEGTNEQVGS